MERKEKISVSGMSCAHCELTIEDAVLKLQGINFCKASFGKSQVTVGFDDNMVKLKEIKDAINKLDYQCINGSLEGKKEEPLQVVYLLVILLGGYLILKNLGIFNIFNIFPQIQDSVSYGMLFIIGILTSLHCVAMCGGINLAQSVNSTKNNKSAVLPNLLYNLGRVISYTIIGGIVGGLGSVISLSGSLRGAVAIFAGVFMMIMGLNMLNVFPWLKRFNLRMPKTFGRMIGKRKAGKHSSFYIGLLNGLMPCGPLQSMQLFALSTGSFVTGAVSMFLFSLGTVPLMFLLGAMSSKLNQKFTKKMMSICAILVVALGFGMFNNGLALTGIALPSIEASKESASDVVIEDGYQILNTSLNYGTYPAITVKNNVPVKWTLTAKDGMINGCNNEIIIPEYGLRVQLHEGDNLIEFTPTKTGTILYSCWMGMIRSSITITQ